MAVYTQISQKEISLIQSNFNLEKIVNFKGIKQGIENTNYFLITKKNKYVLTIFEKRVKKSELPFFMKLMDRLSLKGISCPRPLKNKKENYLLKFQVQRLQRKYQLYLNFELNRMVFHFVN